MKCPYCSVEMEKGTLNADSRGGMYWLKEGDNIIVVTAKNIKKHKGIFLVKPSFIGPA